MEQLKKTFKAIMSPARRSTTGLSRNMAREMSKPPPMGTMGRPLSYFRLNAIWNDPEEGKYAKSIRISWALRSIPRWWDLVTTTTGIERDVGLWYQRLKEQNVDLSGLWLMDKDFSSFTMAINTLPYYKGLIDGLIYPGPLHGTWVADFLVDETTRTNLLSAVVVLEDVPESEKDWNQNPGTNNLVQNLVHPSLYCAVAERTNVLKEPCAAPVTVTMDGYKHLLQFPSSTESYLTHKEVRDLFKLEACDNLLNFPLDDLLLDDSFRWLPSDVMVNEDASIKFLSYVNNLHPIRHREIYQEVEEVLGKFIPMFEMTLKDIRYPATEMEKQGKGYSACDPVKEVVSLRNRTVQVIVKLSNILLTPDNSYRYPGGVWHIEGADNEQIVAVGVYYYSSENIVESQLALGHRVHAITSTKGPRGFRSVVETVKDKHLASIPTPQGRCLVFPNTVQHKVLPFELADKKRPGHRKLLAFFLVDPESTVLSTARVPPQQKSWAETGHSAFMSLTDARKYRDDMDFKRGGLSLKPTRTWISNVTRVS